MRLTRGQRSSQPRGFTLIELMISIALVLLLMVGVNQVFKITGETVSVSQTLADSVRDSRAAQVVMGEDMSNAATNLNTMPYFIIRSERIAAFKDRTDELGDRDYNPPMARAATDMAIRTIDIDGNNSEADPGDETPRALYGNRNKRIDQLAFFAGGAHIRQTGNDGVFSADMSSNEAMIWYGHLKQPDSTGLANAYRPLGTGATESPVPNPLYTFQTNPNNFYSTQWVLGRMVVLLREPDIAGQIKDNTGVSQNFITTTGSPSPYAPLGQRSKATGPGNWEIQWSRYDLAGTSLKKFHDDLITGLSTNPDFFEGAFGLMYRFQGSPFPNKPLSSDDMARVSPALLQHCSNFIVEYAGDFLEQNNDPTSTNYGHVEDVNGNTNALEPDGQIDFIVNPITKAKSIRWYGFPRDTGSNNANPQINGKPDGRIEGYANGRNANDLCDVVPLRDVARTAAGQQAFVGYPFERKMNDPTNGINPKSNYAAAGSGGVALDDRYVCAWGPDINSPLPRMIRFVFTIEDPSGRIPEGQTYEFVFKVGP